MNTKMYETVRNVTNTVTNWLNKHSFKLVLIMSLFHVGLAYIHTRDSGRADPLPSPDRPFRSMDVPPSP